MRWDRNYKEPEIINDPVVIPAYGVTDVERAYWNAKQEALEYDRYPTLRSDKHCTSGVIHRALEDYKTAAVELSQAFFLGQVDGLVQIKNACEDAVNDAAESAINASEAALAASDSKDAAAISANNAFISANTAVNNADAANNSKLAAAQSALDAQQNGYDAEAWAVGTRNGTPVDSEDPTYHNNCRYYAALGTDILQDDVISLYTTWSSDKLNTAFSNKANLVGGKIPASELPSYVDDVIEGYYNSFDHKFYEESTFETEIIPETGKLYVNLSDNRTYRWTGSVYAQMDAGLVLGEISGTAYEGSKGKANADAIVVLQNAVAGKANSADLANVATSGSYTDLNNKPTIPTALSDLSDDTTHRVVTDAEKAVWNNKADASSIPTDLADLSDDSTHRVVTDTEKTAWNNKADTSDITAAFNGVTFTKDANDILYINW